MKSILNPIIASLLVISSTPSCLAEEGNSFVKGAVDELLYSSGRAVMKGILNGLDKALNDSQQPKEAFVNVTFYKKTAEKVPSFRITAERINNPTAENLDQVQIHLWACYSEFNGGTMDGVCIGKFDYKTNLKGGWGFSNVDLEIPVDMDTACIPYVRTGQHPIIYMTLSGKKASDDKLYIYGWCRGDPYNFSLHKWIK